MEKIDIEKELKEGKTLRIRPEGYSMYPMLVPGRDEVLLRTADVCTLRRGDVALYRRPAGILVLHRIWRCCPEGFYMVGDNQTAVEGPIAPEQIRGKLVGFVRNGRYFSTEDMGYRLAAAIWLRLRPLRRCIAVPIASLKRLLKH